MGKSSTENGIVFIYLHGTVAFQIPDDDGSRRLSLAMAITERGGYLLTWFFAAPHDAELQGLTNERALFDKTVNVASAGKPTPSETQPRAASDAACFNAAQTVQSAASASPASWLSFEHDRSGNISAASSGTAASAPDSANQQQSLLRRREFRPSFALASRRNRGKPARQRRGHRTEMIRAVQPKFLSDAAHARAAAEPKGL